MAIENNEIDNLVFSQYFNSFNAQLRLLENNSYQRMLIYGAGTIGNMISKFFPEKTIAFVDQKADSETFSRVGNIKVISSTQITLETYDVIVISVLGREEEILSDLINNHHIDAHKIFTFKVVKENINEYREILKILDTLRTPNSKKTMIQIGASEGGLVERFAHMGWDAYGFDANPKYAQNYNLLNKQNDVHLYNQAVALGDEDTITFYISEHLDGIGSLKNFHPTHMPIDVKATKLTKFYHQNEIKFIDFFMVDAELMDLEIMKTHDWSIPISALLMECSISNVMEIFAYIHAMEPLYEHVVFAYEKPTGKVGEIGVCRDMVSAKAFSLLPKNFFGNIFFWKKS